MSNKTIELNDVETVITLSNTSDSSEASSSSDVVFLQLRFGDQAYEAQEAKDKKDDTQKKQVVEVKEEGVKKKVVEEKEKDSSSSSSSSDSTGSIVPAELFPRENSTSSPSMASVNTSQVIESPRAGDGPADDDGTDFHLILYKTMYSKSKAERKKAFEKLAAFDEFVFSDMDAFEMIAENGYEEYCKKFENPNANN